MTRHPSELANLIAGRCREQGFALAGVCAAEPSRYAHEFQQWIAAGKHGEMSYLARNGPIRLDPGALLPGARSIVMVADQYHTRSAPSPELPPGHGRVARYAQGADYHAAMKTRLHTVCDLLRAEHPGAEFRAFVDTAPVPERELAALAGLGWIGRNTLLINPRLGSWLFLGGFATTLELVSERGPAHAAPMVDHCGTCTRCVDACPTHALSSGPARSLDAARCISYLTIEHRTPIAPELQPGIGDWMYGCDVCQEVCPHNSPRDAGVDVGAIHAAYRPVRQSLPLLEVLGWTEEDRRRALKGSAMKRASLEMFHRNAAIVRQNAG